MTRFALGAFATSLSLLVAGSVSAATVEITITNEQAADGLFLTPLFVAFHDGSYDLFDAGSTVSRSLESLAEEGDASGLVADATAVGANTGVIASPGGVAPIIDPGESATLSLDVDAANRFLSFASMVIPSNDLFIGNDEAIEVLGIDGSVIAQTLAIYGSNVWDAGTEVNDGEGAAFSSNGNPSNDENGVAALQGSLDFIIGTETAPGFLIGSVASSATPLATIIVAEPAPVPLPASLPLLGLSLLGLGAMRRRA